LVFMFSFTSYIELVNSEVDLKGNIRVIVENLTSKLQKMRN